MLRLLKIETFSASKLFALSKQLSHPICLIGIDLVSPFRILEEALSVMIFFFFSVSDLCSTQDDYGKQKIKFLCSNFVSDIKGFFSSVCW